MDLDAYLKAERGELVKKFKLSSLKADDPVEVWVKELFSLAHSVKLVSAARHSPIAKDLDQSMLPEEFRDTPEFPKRLVSDRAGIEEAKFIIVNDLVISAKRRKYLLLGCLVLAAVLLLCLFPLWPFRVQVIIWSFAYYFSLSLIVISFVRLILFMVVWFLGFDFWLLPNLYDEERGIITSFMPLYSISKVSCSPASYLMRAFLAVLVGASFIKLQQKVDFHNLRTDALQLMSISYEWGVNKLRRADGELNMLSYESDDISKEELLIKNWNLCAKYCQFESGEEFFNLCAADCDCLHVLHESKCTNKCSDIVRNDLIAKLQNCSVVDPKVSETEVAYSADDQTVANSDSENTDLMDDKEVVTDL